MLEFLKTKRFWADDKKLESGFPEFAEEHLGSDCIFVASSGTTANDKGRDKWIELSHKAVELAARRQASALGMEASDVFLSALPDSHIAYVAAKVRCEIKGAKFIELRKAEHWDAKTFCDSLVESKATMSSLVPAQVFDILQAGLRARSLPGFRILVGGGSVSDAQIIQARKLGWKLLRSYGSTEFSAMLALNFPADWEKEDYRMKAIEGVRIKHNEELAPLCIQSDHHFRSFHYYDPVKKANITEDYQSLDQYFFETEDLGTYKGEFVEIFGRGSRFCKILGENVFLDQVENKLRNYLDSDFSLIPLSHDRRGVSIVYFGLLGKDTLKNIQSFNKAISGPYRVTHCFDAAVYKAENHKPLYRKMADILVSETEYIVTVEDT